MCIVVSHVAGMEEVSTLCSAHQACAKVQLIAGHTVLQLMKGTCVVTAPSCARRFCFHGLLGAPEGRPRPVRSLVLALAAINSLWGVQAVLLQLHDNMSCSCAVHNRCTCLDRIDKMPRVSLPFINRRACLNTTVTTQSFTPAGPCVACCSCIAKGYQKG